MTLRFKLSSVELIEFGIGLGKGEDRYIARVPVSPDVSDILHQMVSTTWSTSHGMLTNMMRARGNMNYPKSIAVPNMYT